jgi:hypothetical protein
MTTQTRRLATLPAICLAALSILAFSSTADAQWGRDGAVRRPPGTYDRGRAYNPGYSIGYDDGYDKGREDARDRDRFDVRRHSRFRSADHGYSNRFGSRDQYRQFYRRGFSDGYERGYRENIRGRGGRWDDRDPWRRRW